MQKYLYRKVILSLILIVFAIDISADITRLPTVASKKILYKELLSSRKNIKLNISDFNQSAFKQKTLEFMKKIKKESDGSVIKYGAKVFDTNLSSTIKKAVSGNELNTTKNTIFYFYSTSMPLSTIRNLLPQIKKLKEIDKNIQFLIVLNGFPKQSFFKDLRKLYKDEYKGLFTVKIHPFIYKYYKLKMVPAYALISCAKGSQFRFKKCRRDDSYLARGDMSIEDFYQVLGEQDKKYKDIYNKLIEAK